MTATSVLPVAPCAIDSSHMSIRCPSTFRERSSRATGARRLSAPRQEEIQSVPGGGVSIRVSCPRSFVLLLVLFSFASLFLPAHSQTLDEFARNRTALNRQIYFQAFDSLNTTDIRTARFYNASLPSNITDGGVQLESIQMVRLRSGSLRRYGVNFNEITIPIGSTVLYQVRYVVLVYRRFKQYSYYDATNGTVFVAPVVGIMVYSYDNIRNYTSTYGQELAIVAGTAPIQVQLQPSRSIASNELACVSFTNNVNGTDTGVIENVTSSSLCEWNTLGDYSLLGPPTPTPNDGTSSNTWKVVVGSVVGGLAAIVLLVLVALLALWYREKHRFAGMEQKSDQGEPLHHTWFGASRAPSAAGTRTRPILENENV